MKTEQSTRGYPLILISLFLALGVAIVFVGYRHYLSHKNEIMRDKYIELAAVANLKVDQIVKWRSERLADDLLPLKNPFFAEAVARFLLHPESASLRKDLAIWLSPISENRCYHSIVLFDNNLTEKLKVGAENMPVGKLTRSLAAGVLRSGTMVISDLHYGDAISHIHLDVLVPLFVRRIGGSTPIGVVLVRVDPSHELYPLIQSWPTPSPSAETLLVRREGDDVLYLNELRHRKGTALALRQPLTNKALPAVKAVLGYEGGGRGVDYRGVPALFAARKIPGSSWYLVAKVDSDEILAPVRRQAWFVILGAVFLILLAGMGVVFLWRRAGAKHFKRLYEEELVRHVLTGHIERLSRLYHTQSHVNQAIVRCRDRQELFDEVCRILVEDGGFRMVWIGLADRANGYLRPVAFSGYEEGYLEKVAVSTDDVPGGRGPSGRALREGRHFVCLDIATDLSMKPWREDALRCGYRSSAAFPVFIAAECVGTLNVYASEPNFFEGEIVALLDELAADVSFALAAMDQSELLRANEKRFQRISEIMSDFAFSCLKQPCGPFMIDWMTGAVEEISGYSIEEIHERGSWDFLVLEEDLPLFREKVTGLAPGETGACELRIRAKDGTIRRLLSSCRCDVEDDSPTYRLFGGCRDCTEQRKAQELIVLNEARLQSLYNISQYRAANVQGLLDFSLAEALRLTASKFGYIYFYDEEKKEFILNSWSNEVMKGCSVVQPQTRYELDKTGIWGEAVRQRRPILVNDFQGCNPLKKGYPPGHVELFSYMTIPVFFGERIVAVVGVANKGGAYDETDVRQLTLLSDSVWKYVERKNTEEELIRLNMELETRILERTADLESFTYTVSHDLRAPLRAISGFSGILLDEYTGALDAEGRRLLNVIIDNTRRMGQLIDDLLSFSRLGRSEINLSSIDMAALARDVFDEIVTGEMREKITCLIGTLPEAKGDASLLRQVWVNLLSNAVKFTAPKGAGLIEVGATPGEDEDLFYVKDTGVGFDMQYAHKLFGIFQRLHSTSEFEGTGIGLSIVQRIVDRHGGRVWAEGRQGEGATFCFSLPKKGVES
jgi:PAS domain S-box-containing protein